MATVKLIADGDLEFGRQRLRQDVDVLEKRVGPDALGADTGSLPDHSHAGLGRLQLTSQHFDHLG
jgi:hypothetical protein